MPDWSTAPGLLLISVALGYVLGSIPFGLVMSRLFGLGDVRKIGSGNIGATNVLRTGNKAAAALTLVLDGLKGAVAVLIVRGLAGEDAVALAGLAAFLGHCFPVWLGFKGGKGVATFLGVWLALAFPVGLACCAAWAATAAFTRISSAGALGAAAASPVLAILSGREAYLGLAIVMAVLVFVRHRENIARMRSGTEPRIGSNKS